MNVFQAIGSALSSIFDALNNISFLGVSYLYVLIFLLLFGLIVSFLKGKK